VHLEAFLALAIAVAGRGTARPAPVAVLEKVDAGAASR